MNHTDTPVLDHGGHVMFRCGGCAGPMSQADILDLGLRLPEPGETANDYLDAELIDALRHERCADGAPRAAS
jgi:hypothetical protein